jgi:hypothetical protein
MALLTRNLMPVVEPRRRPIRRDLLPGGTQPGLRRAATPAQTLTRVAAATLRGARRPDRRPARWSGAAFAREVDLVRLHLVPIRSRDGLAASFAREAFHADLATVIDDSIDPVSAAYAIRWLELGDGVALGRLGRRGSSGAGTRRQAGTAARARTGP